MADIVAEMKAKEEAVRADKMPPLFFVPSFQVPLWRPDCPEPVLANHRAHFTRNLLLKDTCPPCVFSSPFLLFCTYGICMQGEIPYPKGAYPGVVEEYAAHARCDSLGFARIPDSSLII